MENLEKEITIVYKIGEKIRLFGDKFVENNKDNCKLIINNKEEELKSFIEKKRC